MCAACTANGVLREAAPVRPIKWLVYIDTLAPKNTLANLTPALLETKAVQAFVVAASSSQTTHEH